MFREAAEVVGVIVAAIFIVCIIAIVIAAWQYYKDVEEEEQ